MIRTLAAIAFLCVIHSGPLLAQRPTPERVASITKDGVTWRFSEPVEAGQFVNGDYYVVGPVTVTAISPEPQKIAPKETDMTIKGTRIELVAAPYSVSVLRVKLM